MFVAHNNFAKNTNYVMEQHETSKIPNEMYETS